MTAAGVGPRIDGHVDDGSVIAESVRQPERFAVIFDRYFAEIHRYVERRMGTDAADEIASDTFVAAFGRRDRFQRDRPSARPWLFGIATNLIGKHRRRRTSAVRAYQRSGAADVAEGHEDRVAARITAQQRHAELAEAMAELSRGERDVLLLVALADFSHDEVAQALGIPYGTVASRLSRARAKLRRRLTDPTELDEEYPHG